jgi:23S rRNA (adenine2503-C2)-methyltransferase
MTAVLPGSTPADRGASAPRSALLGLPRPELESALAALGEKPFRARQIMRWLYGRAVTDPGAMTDLSGALRERLGGFDFSLPRVHARQDSADGTVKWRLATDDGQLIETVFIPEGERGTLCVSSQVGCAMDCSFCATGKQGFNRNLTAAEIIGQVILATRELAPDGGPVPKHLSGRAPITNIVFMGMGEPLANFRPVVQACHILVDDLGFQLSRRRVTVSTSGLVPQMRRLAEETRVALAVSLHAPDDELRNQLVPINRRHPIAELLEACWEYAEAAGLAAITFEYALLAGVNDGEEQARALVKLLKGRPAKLNLIPFNPFPGTVYRRPDGAAIDRFRQVLQKSGIMAITRRTRGDDIAAACGQLAGQVNNRVRVPLGSKLHEVRW